MVDSCSTTSCDTGCTPKEKATGSTNRRNFLKASAMTSAMLMTARVQAMAGPFSASDFDSIIPADKKLSKDWIASLYERGTPLTVLSDEFEYLGMPIGGISTGQVYLSGDGQLWYWNLDAEKRRKNNPKGPGYMDPDSAIAPEGDGFALKVGDQVRPLNTQGFRQVKFTNQYPMGIVDYADEDCPVSVQLEAYSPFIPLNRDKSSFPVVVMRYTVKNRSSSRQSVSLAGWVENNKNGRQANRVNEYRQYEDITTVECSAAKLEDANSIALGIFGSDKPDFINIEKTESGANDVFEQNSRIENGTQYESSRELPSYASLGKNLSLEPGESKTVSFAVSWRIPLINYGTGFGYNTSLGRNHYSTEFLSAALASNEVASNEAALYGASKEWVDTWYDSSLPYWFLERTFIPINTMQTQTAQRIYPQGSDTEIYNLEEGVRCCPGNCTHVWNYAQGLARVFPEIERECRDKIEYGLGFNENNGMVFFRYTSQDGKDGRDDALDGTCGTIIRVLRESQMTTDYRFLENIWDRVKLSMEFVIQEWDADEDGILEGAQHNTLDEPWYGQVHWLINVYHAALKSAAVMARQMKEPALADRYDAIVATGAPKMVDMLWSEEFGYFIHKPGESDAEKHGSTNGCHIDQVLGESWLHEVGLDPVLPKEKTKKALQALWKYNFSPDIGVFRETMTEGRWYAALGEAGLIMCSFPNGKIEPKSGNKNYAGYLNECMTGFEWQVSAHMLREGMVEEGLAIGKAIYDRYQPGARNPYNEIECSDHYSRAMASYGAYLAACGYRYDGPEAKLAFAPSINPDDFRAAFTAAEGWGRFSQKVEGSQQSASLDVRYGRVELKEFSLKAVSENLAQSASVSIDGRLVSASFSVINGHYVLKFDDLIIIEKGQQLELKLG